MSKQLNPLHRGPPPHVPTQETREVICRMAACGLNDREVSFALAIPLDEIRRWYADELVQGLAVTTAKVGGALIDAALRGDTNAAAFFLRARSRWTTPTKATLDDAANGPAEVAAREALVASILKSVNAQATTAKRREGEAPSPQAGGTLQ